MTDPVGEPTCKALRVDFDRRLMLSFGGAVVTSDEGFLAYCERDHVLGLTGSAGDVLADARTGRHSRHALVRLLHQSVFGRHANYKRNDAERLCRDPAMRWVVSDRAVCDAAASASEMGRFETESLTRSEPLAALAHLSGQWIDRVYQQRPPKLMVLPIESSERPSRFFADSGRAPSSPYASLSSQWRQVAKHPGKRGRVRSGR